MGHVQIKFEGDDPTVVSLIGALSQNFDPKPILAALAQDKSLVIDMSGIKRIDSTGVREWLHFIRGVDLKKLTFRNIAPAMVQQIAMVANILPIDRIESLLLPFVCDNCEHELLLNATCREAVGLAKANRDCPSCGGKGSLAFDDIVDLYVGWLGDTPVVTDGSAADGVDIVSNNANFVDTVKRTIPGVAIRTHSDSDGLVTRRIEQENVGALIIDVDSLPWEVEKKVLADLAHARDQGVGTPVVMGCLSVSDRPHAWFEECRVQHWLPTFNEQNTQRCIDGIVQIVTGKPPAFSEHAASSDQVSWSINSTEQLGQALNDLREASKQRSIRSRLTESFVSTVAELGTNALFHSPVDGGGERVYADQRRSIPVFWRPDDAPAKTADGRHSKNIPGKSGHVEIKTGFSADRCIISVKDPYGSLKIDTVIDYLGRALRFDDTQVLDDASGGGIGIYSSLMFSSSLAYIINPGKYTEVIATFEKIHSFRDFAAVEKSLNCFVTN